jgi:hypothetical protein
MKTESEELFERFLASNNLPFEKIEEVGDTRTPDYRVTIGGSETIFELKQLDRDRDFGVVRDPANPQIKSNSRTMGDHIQRRINHSSKQIQFGADQGIPSILLIYNNIDPGLNFGTEPMDFIAAMYGEYTISKDCHTGMPSDWFNGNGQMLQESKNTSFSAVGHLCHRAGTTTVTLYENIYAKVKIPYTELPPCFDVRRIEVSSPGTV